MANAPIGEVFTVSDRGDGKKGWWTRIGTAWKNKDGSINITLDALPLNGQLVMRKPQPRDESGGTRRAPPKPPPDDFIP